MKSYIGHQFACFVLDAYCFYLKIFQKYCCDALVFCHPIIFYLTGWVGLTWYWLYIFLESSLTGYTRLAPSCGNLISQVTDSFWEYTSFTLSCCRRLICSSLIVRYFGRFSTIFYYLKFEESKCTSAEM